jgi:hypothetical protein
MIKSRRMRWAEHVVCVGEMSAYNFLESLKKETTRKEQAQMEDNIKMHRREIWLGAVDLIHLTQDKDRWRALVNTVKNLRVP